MKDNTLVYHVYDKNEKLIGIGSTYKEAKAFLPDNNGEWGKNYLITASLPGANSEIPQHIYFPEQKQSIK
jgi:hypothetical protein